MIPLLILAHIFSVFYSPTIDETMVFNVVHNDKIVGELNAVYSSDGIYSKYENETTIHTRIIKKIEVVYLTEVVFEKEILFSSHVKIMVNGKLYSEAKTIRDGGGYKFYQSGKFKKNIAGDIAYSSVMLLFEEPKGVKAAYSEEGGNYYNIEPAGNFTYRKINSKGRASIYQYENQDLQNVNVDAGLVKFHMVLKTSQD